MTEITQYQPTSPVEPSSAPPGLTEWVQNLSAAHKIATALCSTSFVPQHFRGKADEAAAAILYGHEVGFSPTTSLQTLYVIGGKPAMYARPMVALVQANGHEVWTESKTDTSVTVCGRRRGSEHVIRETWDMDRAKKAGYTSNKKYQTDPQAMLYARAASDVCRQVAADVLTGIGYSVEEMQLAGNDLSGGQPAPAQRQSRTSARDTLAAAVAPDEPEPADVSDAEVVEEEPEPLKDSTRKHLFALMGEAGVTDDDAQRAFLTDTLGRPVESRSTLTEAEAHTAGRRLRAWLDGDTSAAWSA